MQISWLAPDQIAAARAALRARAPAWEDHFSPEFAPPPMPDGVVIGNWAGITEHVARAERVSEVIREQGLDAARARFGASSRAIEQATLASAAHQADELDFDAVTRVLDADIDELVFYAPFLELLIALGRAERDRALRTYESFAAAFAAAPSTAANWRDRIRAVRDGLASAYVDAGRLDDGHALFATRHDEDRGDVAVALSASRSFLAAGEVARSIHWLGIGAERADELGRADMALRLRDKVTSLRRRLA